MVEQIFSKKNQENPVRDRPMQLPSYPAAQSRSFPGLLHHVRGDGPAFSFFLKTDLLKFSSLP